MSFEQKCTDILVEIDNILQKIVIDYSLIKYPTVVTEFNGKKTI
jgi:hypothetical protein